MRMRAMMTTGLLVAVTSALGAQARDTSTMRIPIHKDGTTGTAAGVLSTPLAPDTVTTVIDTTTPAYYYTTDTTLYRYRPLAKTCSSVDVSAARAVAIKTSLYDPASMISPDSAKVIALCAVPGQIGSGEMNMANGVPEYAIDVIPNHKKTHTKVIVDATTGAVISSKQFGGLRGAAGWVRESWEHKENVKKAKKDTMP